ncbi:MAG TPA: hypothetical protein VIL13_13155 [Longimicrobiales bacterium]
MTAHEMVAGEMAGLRAGRRPGASRAWPASTTLTRRRVFAATAALVLLHVFLALLVFNPAPHPGGDNAVYLSLARSLLSRGEYLSLYDPATPPHTQYPPVFPGILAVALLAGLRPWVGLKLIVVCFSAAAVALSYLWLLRRRRPGLALGVALLLAIAPGVLDLSHWVLSDVPFWAFVMLALWGFERLGPGEHRRFGIAVAATVLACFTRMAGLPLALAAFGWLGLRRRWRQAAVLAAILLPFGFLWWLRAHAHGGSEYGQVFWLVDPYRPALGRLGPADLLRRMIENDHDYLTRHLPYLLFGQDGRLVAVLGVGIAVLAIFGWVRRLGRPGVAEIFCPLYAGMLLLWPAIWSGERFLLPVLPLILAYAGDAFGRAVRRARLHTFLPAGAAAVLALLLVAVPGLQASVRTGARCQREYREGRPYACLPRRWQDFLELARWARAELPDGAVVISRKPALFYLYSGLRGRMFPLSADPAEFLRTAEQAGARYVVADPAEPLQNLYLTPVLRAEPDAFCLVRSLGPGRPALLGVLPGGRASAVGRADAGTGVEETPTSVEESLPICPEDYRRRPPSR